MTTETGTLQFSGYVVVPREPTQAMIDVAAKITYEDDYGTVGMVSIDTVQDVYTAMIRAADCCCGG